MLHFRQHFGNTRRFIITMKRISSPVQTHSSPKRVSSPHPSSDSSRLFSSVSSSSLQDTIARYVQKNKAYIGGKWVESNDHTTFGVINPATGEEIWQVADMGPDETNHAIEVAHEAFKKWRTVPAKERSQILRKMFNLIMDHQDDLALIMTAECGKPLSESKGEVAYSASFIEWFAEEAKRTYGSVIPAHQSNAHLQYIKQPIGVCGLVTPWNFPLAMHARKVAPAIAAGCSTVLKPAHDTPLSALAMATLGEQAGLPSGLYNVVTSKKASDVGNALCDHSLVRKLSFTGSTKVGKILLERCAQTVKKVSMELGGNAPFIIFDDADLDKAVEGALVSKFRFGGQTCVCANRIFVHEKVYDSFAEKLAAKLKEMKVGDGARDDVKIGPLIHSDACKKVADIYDDAVSKGARVYYREELPQELRDRGSFYPPTILTDVTKDMNFMQEEIFGPLAPLVKFSDESDVIAQANDTNVGLAGYFYTKDLSRAFRVAESLEVGMVGINSGLISNEAAPFGGVKESGLGREGSHLGIDEYMEVKYLCFGNV